MKKKEHEDFINEMNIINPNISFIGLYQSRKRKIACQCNVCGHQWLACPDNLLSGKGCPRCASEKISRLKQKTHEQFLHDLHNKHPNIMAISTYAGAHKKMKFKCSTCEHVWETTPHSVLMHKGCPQCSYRKTGLSLRKTHSQFLSDLSVIDPMIVPLDEYQSARRKMLFRCVRCGNVWSANPIDVIHGTSCPNCSMSKGERRIDAYLHRRDILHEHQKKYNDLLGIKNRKLSFDFFLPEINTLIEYQGEFHDHSVSFQSEEDFLSQEKHDQLKKAYAIKNQINVIYIWYYEFELIDEILEKSLQNPVTITA